MEFWWELVASTATCPSVKERGSERSFLQNPIHTAAYATCILQQFLSILFEHELNPK